MLEEFGFTPTEGRAYRALLRLGPSTGYVIARDLGIARANAYQALDSLTRRSAARRSVTTPVRYSPVPPGALLAELERTFRTDLAQLEHELRALPQAGAAGLTDLDIVGEPSHLLARCAEAVDTATRELLVLTGPWAPGPNARLPFAVRRGVAVHVVSLGGPIGFAPATVRGSAETELRREWGGLPVAVVADGERAVCGVVAGSGASGVASSLPGFTPFVRELLRREMGAGA